MFSHSCVLFRILVLFTVLVTAWCKDFYCRQNDIEECLMTSYNYLRRINHRDSFIYTSLDHYINRVEKINHTSYEIHVDALNTIMLPLDDIIVQKNRHEEACRNFNESLRCIKPHKEYCDGWVRDELEGIMEVFKEVCKPISKQVFSKDDPCTLREEVIEDAKQCEIGLNNTIKDLIPHLECLDESNVTAECIKKRNDFVKLMYEEGVIIPVDSDGASVVMRSKICVGVQRTLTCLKDHITDKCGNKAGDWEYNLRHKLVHLLLVDLDCDDEGDGYIIDGYFHCDKDKKLNRTQVCDGTPDCEDMSDEAKKRCGKRSMSVLTILIIVIIVLVVAGIVVACVVKCVQEKHYGKFSRGGIEEMTDIVAEEQSLGRSTPPPNSYNTKDARNANYIYKPVQA